jgi:dynein regulatory complex protein 1
MANVIDDKSYRTWLAVYAGMEKYHDLLSQRWQVSEKITKIEQQNGELKSLLRQYMSARVNDELQIPPTQIMLAQAGMLSE